jgi:TonB-dependent receptor
MNLYNLKRFTTLMLTGFFLCLNLWAQTPEINATSIVRGRIIDNTNAKAVYGAELSINELNTTTDIDGKFEFSVIPGTYQLSIELSGYADLTISDINAIETVTDLGDIRISPATETIGQVNVSVKRMQNTEEALLTAKRIAPNLIDGISSASFKRIGDGDAASAMKRVTGVSIEGGKYVYVRGLGDRYTKTTLNGMDIPGLDPDRNTIQMDLFPTSVIDNIVVAKTFTADLPADFTGGIVDLATKDFPTFKSFNVSAGIGYNPSMNLQNDYVTYEGGSTDFLGFDNGSRANPTNGMSNIPSTVDVLRGGKNAEQYYSVLNGFNPNLGTVEKTSPLNFDFSISFANTKRLNKKYTLGYQSALTYKNQTEFYRDAEFNLWAKPNETNQNELIPFELQKGNYGTNNVILAYLGSIAIKSKSDKFNLNLLHIQNGESRAGKFYFENSVQGANWEAQQYNLEYNQRSLTNLYLTGKHIRDRGNWTIEWKIAPTRSAMSDPDIRFTRIRVPDLTISSEAGFPTRIWRELEEYNVANRIDFTRKTQLLGLKSNIKFGGAYTFKYRDFSIESFQLQGGIDGFDDPQVIMKPENLFSPTNQGGFYYVADFVDGNGFRKNPNAFEGRVNYAAAYVSTETEINSKLKVIAGLRTEMYTQFYSGLNQTGQSLKNEKVMEDFGLFPTVNGVYQLGKSTNLRASYARTTARPSFKELSFAQILDPITGRSFQGGLFGEETTIFENGTPRILQLWDGNLRSSIINNFDIRWESFKKKGDMISVGLFYKGMKDPIEIVQYVADDNAYQPRNVGNASLYGAEFELRQNLEIIASELKQFYFNTNLTYTYSQISINDAEFLSKTYGAREGQTISRKREMAGQAPYIINGGLSWMSKAKRFEGGVYYNVQGATLQFVGYANRADIISVPFHSLNFSASGKFGYKNRMNLGVQVSNLLNDKRESIFRSYQAQQQYFQRLSPGTAVSVKFSYSL